ncbi:MAG: HAMP domain-containing histidine kinase [Chloroflexota bacterium]|nr:HAMP domain-containing histidine kinase [Chloroflexota bacterium]
MIVIRGAASIATSEDPEARAERFSRLSDLGWVADLLLTWREEVLRGWLEATKRQPFHQGRSEYAVADHIPSLFDAVVGLLQRYAPPAVDAISPLDDSLVLEAAEDHARTRLRQGLQPSDVVTEFRLLRQEIGRVLRLHMAADAPVRDVIGAELLANDALDGAIALALASLTRRLEEVRQEVLAVTVHDVRQPMTALKGNIQVALHVAGDLLPLVPRAQGILVALQRAGQAVDRMDELLAQVSAAARLALGRSDLHPGTTDLADIVQCSLARLSVEAAGRITVDIPYGTDVTGEWDRSALSQVIDNLLSNAVKYSPLGSAIVVAVQAGDLEGTLTPGEPPPGEPPGQAGRSAVHLSVHDHGIGLTPEELAGLFQRYGRAAGARQRQIEGQGLGLYLSHGIVRAHGGRIWVESPGPGQGTTMHVLLPRTMPAPQLVS